MLRCLIRRLVEKTGSFSMSSRERIVLAMDVALNALRHHAFASRYYLVVIQCSYCVPPKGSK